MRLPLPVLAPLAALAALGGCGGDSKPAGVPFPDRLPPHTRLAVAYSAGGVTGGHALIAVQGSGRATIHCRFGGTAAPVTLPAALRARWEAHLAAARLGATKSDDPRHHSAETPQLWVLYRDRVVYRQPGARAEGAPRLFTVANEILSYVDTACR